MVCNVGSQLVHGNNRLHGQWLLEHAMKGKIKETQVGTIEAVRKKECQVIHAIEFGRTKGIRYDQLIRRSMRAGKAKLLGRCHTVQAAKVKVRAIDVQLDTARRGFAWATAQAQCQYFETASETNASNTNSMHMK